MSDLTHADAVMAMLGRSFAEMFAAMIAGGMTRIEALHVLIAYAKALAGSKE